MKNTFQEISFLSPFHKDMHIKTHANSNKKTIEFFPGLKKGERPISRSPDKKDSTKVPTVPRSKPSSGYKNKIDKDTFL